MALFSWKLETDRREYIKEFVYRAAVQAIHSLAEVGRLQGHQASAIVREASAAPAPRELPFAAPSYLDSGCKVSGKLHFEGAARIDGHIDGEIDADNIIVIGNSAVVTAKINAESVILAGSVSGEITASQRIEIRASADMQGPVTAPKLVIDEGAVLTGHCATQPEEAACKLRATQEPRGERDCLPPMTSLGEILGRFN